MNNLYATNKVFHARISLFLMSLSMVISSYALNRLKLSIKLSPREVKYVVRKKVIPLFEEISMSSGVSIMLFIAHLKKRNASSQ